MLRRRPAAVYELLAEDEFLERGRAEDPADRRCDDGASRAHRDEPVASAAVSTAGPAASAARRTLLVALTAAALVGFAVWELLGIASDSVASRPGAAFQALRPDLGQPRQLGRHGSRAPRRGQRPQPVTRSLQARRAAATETRPRAGMPAPPALPVSSSAIQPGAPATLAAPAAPLPPTTITSLAEQEFGFER